VDYPQIEYESVLQAQDGHSVFCDRDVKCRLDRRAACEFARPGLGTVPTIADEETLGRGAARP
jgi:hypothetical protein